MIKNLFITPDGKCRGRWLEAFPEAIVVGAESADQAVMAELVWVDYDSLRGEKKFMWLQQYINPAKKTVVLSNVPNDAEALEVIQAGAYGYCHAFAAPNQLVEIATVINHGGLWLGPHLLQQVLKAGVAAANPNNEPPPSHLLALLSKREKVVAGYIAHGASNKEISQALAITERTVKAHISSMFEKLAVRDRVQLALKLNNVSI
jgi:DNA-binding NarL/FixJ family response regulator